MKHLAAFASITSLGLALTACGGSGDGAGQSAAQSVQPSVQTTTAATPSSGKPQPAAKAGSKAKSHSKAGGTAAESDASPQSMARRYPHGDNSIQTYGHAGGASDRQVVDALVKRYYAAVADGDGARVCSMMSASLSASIVQGLSRSPKLQGKGCGPILSLLFKPRSGAARASLTDVRVTAVRLKGDKGFALLRSKSMPSGEIPVVREHGKWKIGGLIGSTLP